MVGLTRLRLGAALLVVAGALGSSPGAGSTADAVILSDYDAGAQARVADLEPVEVSGAGEHAVAHVAAARARAAAPSSSRERVRPGERSQASAADLEVDAVGGAVQRDRAAVRAEQSALPDHPTADSRTITTVPTTPALAADAATATAHARWNPRGCVPKGSPLASATSELTNARFLSGTPAEVSVVNEADGSGAVYAETTTRLVPLPRRTTLGVEAVARAQLTSLTLLDGLVRVDVLAPPVLTARATGSPGGATVTYSAPVVRVQAAGQPPVVLDARTVPSTPVNAQVIALGSLSASTTADGTSASGSASLLRVGSVVIAPLAASARTQPGGVVCTPGTGNPLRDSRLTVSKVSVAAGEPFEYLITVPNTSPCEFFDLELGLTSYSRRGQPPLLFEGSTPVPPSYHDGPSSRWYAGGTFPGETYRIRVRVRVPSDALRGSGYSGTASVDALCRKVHYRYTTSVEGPRVR